MMTEKEYQFGLRELPPCKLIEIINFYRNVIHILLGKNLNYIDDLKQIIPEWYKLDK